MHGLIQFVVNVKVQHRILQAGMPGILLGKQGILHRNLPIYPQALVQDTDTGISLRVVEIIAFILEDGCLGQHGETMRKSS